MIITFSIISYSNDLILGDFFFFHYPALRQVSSLIWQTFNLRTQLDIAAKIILHSILHGYHSRRNKCSNLSNPQRSRSDSYPNQIKALLIFFLIGSKAYHMIRNLTPRQSFTRFHVVIEQISPFFPLMLRHTQSQSTQQPKQHLLVCANPSPLVVVTSTYRRAVEI